eukprot:1159388-Pelagomonas_calceolata.AAC.26
MRDAGAGCTTGSPDPRIKGFRPLFILSDGHALCLAWFAVNARCCKVKSDVSLAQGRSIIHCELQQGRKACAGCLASCAFAACKSICGLSCQRLDMYSVAVQSGRRMRHVGLWMVRARVGTLQPSEPPLMSTTPLLPSGSILQPAKRASFGLGAADVTAAPQGHRAEELN